MEVLLECSNISKSYERVQAVQGLDLSLVQGLHYALLGPSGCGKTTTLRLIAGLDTPETGKILLRGNLANDPTIKISPEKRELGMVFQNLALWPHMTVEKNLTFGLRGFPRKGKKEMARERLAMMGLGDRLSAYPYQLSEGERQRVALARAIINGPDFLLLDEPFSNLDRPLKMALLNQIADIGRKEGVTILFVTHDQEEALAVADRLLIMNQGRIAQEGPPEEVYSQPSSPFTGFLLGHGGVVRGKVRDEKVISPLGTFPLEQDTLEGELLLFVRPEDIKLGSSCNGIKGVVVDGHYKGGRWLWEVEVAGNNISVWAKGPPSIGDSVFLEVINHPFLLPEEWKTG